MAQKQTQSWRFSQRQDCILCANYTMLFGLSYGEVSNSLCQSILLYFQSTLGPYEVGSLIVDDYKTGLEVMVAPAMLPVYLDAVEARRVTSTLEYDDFSK